MIAKLASACWPGLVDRLRHFEIARSPPDMRAARRHPSKAALLASDRHLAREGSCRRVRERRLLVLVTTIPDSAGAPAARTAPACRSRSAPTAPRGRSRGRSFSCCPRRRAASRARPCCDVTASPARRGLLDRTPDFSTQRSVPRTVGLVPAFHNAHAAADARGLVDTSSACPATEESASVALRRNDPGLARLNLRTPAGAGAG